MNFESTRHMRFALVHFRDASTPCALRNFSRVISVESASLDSEVHASESISPLATCTEHARGGPARQILVFFGGQDGHRDAFR